MTGVGFFVNDNMLFFEGLNVIVSFNCICLGSKLYSFPLFVMFFKAYYELIFCCSFKLTPTMYEGGITIGEFLSKRSFN